MKHSIKHIVVPEHVLRVLRALSSKGFLAYLVGGCVRDLLMGREPKDWDVATDAHPTQVQAIFPDSVYENEFGTVGVKIRKGGGKDGTEIVEVTTFRKEVGYSDKRHPDSIVFAQSIDEDLSRRDFTINAMALRASDEKLSGDEGAYALTDPFHGQEDLKKKTVRAVGTPAERFGEDALRMMRAVRFACQLDFDIEEETQKAIRAHAHLLRVISFERIRDEFEKIIMTPRAAWGMQMLAHCDLMRHIMPELVEGIGVAQNLHHIYTVWEHSVRALAYATEHEFSLPVRLASLLHDVGKPRTKQGEGKHATFHGHEVVGARLVKKMLERLRFSREIIDHVVHLVRHHQFYYNVGEISEAGVRRFIRRVGVGYIDDLLKVREADRIGSGVPKAFPYKLRHLLFMIDKVRHDPISPSMLAVDGSDVMRITSLSPSPRVGMILNALLEEVLDDPQLNNREYLETRVSELQKLDDKELSKKVVTSKKKQEGFEKEHEHTLKRRHRVS